MPHEIVGVWRIYTKGAPTPYHMFTFHSDGTMQQSNPPAGNTETSDTAGMGVWEAQGKEVKARFEEFRLGLKDGKTTRGVIEYRVRLAKDSFEGDSQFSVYDLETGDCLEGPLLGTFTGQRVTLA